MLSESYCCTRPASAGLLTRITFDDSITAKQTRCDLTFAAPGPLGRVSRPGFSRHARLLLCSTVAVCLACLVDTARVQRLVVSPMAAPASLAARRVQSSAEYQKSHPGRCCAASPEASCVLGMQIPIPPAVFDCHHLHSHGPPVFSGQYGTRIARLSRSALATRI